MTQSQIFSDEPSVPASATFLALPSAPFDVIGDARIALVGAATATPYPGFGAYCADAPAVLREASLNAAGTVGNLNFDLNGPVLSSPSLAVDCGDIAIGADAASNRTAIASTVSSIVRQGAVPVVIGGDDSIPIAVMMGLDTGSDQEPIAVLQIDAHIDWRDEVAGERMGMSSTMRRISELPHVGKIVQVGSRGVGSAREADFAAALARGVHFEQARGLNADAIARAIAALPEGGRVHIVFDADALDPSIMPAVIGRQPGGLGWWEAVDLLGGCAARCRIVAVSFTEFLPSADVGGLGALTATRLLAHIIGLVARQNG